MFGICIYRNSWFLIEQEVARLIYWTSARPAGSLVIFGAGLRVHVYRHGHDATVDLDTFRLDEEASATKRQIAAANTRQLTLDFEEPTESTVDPAPAPPVAVTEFRDLVIVHAGNPDDGCCGIWVGAPVTTEEITASPWAWVEPIWTPEPRPGMEDPAFPAGPSPVPHYELSEPEITLKPIEQDEAGQEGS